MASKIVCQSRENWSISGIECLAFFVWLNLFGWPGIQILIYIPFNFHLPARFVSEKVPCRHFWITFPLALKQWSNIFQEQVSNHKDTEASVKGGGGKGQLPPTFWQERMRLTALLLVLLMYYLPTALYKATDAISIFDKFYVLFINFISFCFSYVMLTFFSVFKICISFIFLKKEKPSV